VPRRPGRLSPAVYIRRSGFYKGVLGGNRGWLAVFAVFWGGKKLRTTFGRSEEIAATEVLQPGQLVTIRAIKPPTRRQRKDARRSAKAARESAPAAGRVA
jgi:hypothetical protein